MLVSLRGSNVDLLHVLFGTVLALDNATLYLLGGITSITLVTLALVYRGLVLECVDPQFLRTVSGAGAPVHFIFLGLVVLNLVGGFHALGTLLAVGMMMLPAAGARLWTTDITKLVVIAVGAGMASGYAGLIASYHAGVPAGPAIILAAGGFYLVSLAFGAEGGFLRRLMPARHLEA